MVCFYFPDHILADLERRRLSRPRSTDQPPELSDRLAYSIVTQPTPATRPPTAPINPQSPSSRPPKAPAAPPPTQPPRTLARGKRPKPRKRPKARLPCNTWATFKAAHTDDPRSIARYQEREFANVRLTGEAQHEIAPEQAFGLAACNYTARIRYAEVATDHITRFTASLPRSTPVFWVTLVRDSHTVRYDDAADFDLFKLQQWVIPIGADHNRYAQSRSPRDMIFQGWAVSLFQV